MIYIYIIIYIYRYIYNIYTYISYRIYISASPRIELLTVLSHIMTILIVMVHWVIAW